MTMAMQGRHVTGSVPFVVAAASRILLTGANPTQSRDSKSQPSINISTHPPRYWISTGPRAWVPFVKSHSSLGEKSESRAQFCRVSLRRRAFGSFLPPRRPPPARPLTRYAQPEGVHRLRE
ncbi:hypothetical protein BHE74_00004692 [Ensete ventricosum]|nr:hypothetical protein BHE74_00004692 [Ensete ventricosum]